MIPDNHQDRTLSRPVEQHLPEGYDSKLHIEATGPMEPGGAQSTYGISWGLGDGTRKEVTIPFQSGPIPDGVNGVTIEALIAVAIDRLHSFQSGPFKSECNEQAIVFLKLAMEWLNRRTINRISRGVEGKLEA